VLGGLTPGPSESRLVFVVVDVVRRGSSSQQTVAGHNWDSQRHILVSRMQPQLSLAPALIRSDSDFDT
jgi:hypothetical protein